MHFSTFVQILRNHVMVRIGGGWDTLESYLDRHDPCRCNSKRKRLFVGQLIFKYVHGNKLHYMA